MEEQKKELKMTRVFDAPRELVYKAWTDVEKVKQWWGPQGVFIPICEMDVTVGGRIYIVMEAGEALGKFKGTQWPMEGTYVELDEPKKIVFRSNAISDGKVLFEHTTTVIFDELPSADGMKTTMNVHVVVTNAVQGSEFAISGMQQGWNSQFDKLGEFIKNN